VGFYSAPWHENTMTLTFFSYSNRVADLTAFIGDHFNA
jgi:hypothetical protein